jgi:hypothetical protein
MTSLSGWDEREAAGTRAGSGPKIAIVAGTLRIADTVPNPIRLRHHRDFLSGLIRYNPLIQLNLYTMISR